MLSRTVRPTNFIAIGRRNGLLHAAVATVPKNETAISSKKPSFLSRFRGIPISVKETQEISVLEQFQKLSKDLDVTLLPNNHPLYEVARKLRERKYLSGGDNDDPGIRTVYDEKIVIEVTDHILNNAVS
jgi:hypothetical protein